VVHPVELVGNRFTRGGPVAGRNSLVESLADGCRRVDGGTASGRTAVQRFVWSHRHVRTGSETDGEAKSHDESRLGDGTGDRGLRRETGIDGESEAGRRLVNIGLGRVSVISGSVSALA
jgi:hypothetical protein